MACNTCSKSFSLLRQEKGCPGCGFSYCSKCLNHKVFLQKLNSEAKVCVKCKNANINQPRKIEPPDAYYKRIGIMSDPTSSNDVSDSTTEQLIYKKLKKLKEGREDTAPKASNEEINARLQKLKGDIPSTSTAELESRLANIKGVPITAVQSKPTLPKPDLRTEQEQADDLMKQFMAQTDIDTKYKDEFDGLVEDIQTRLQKLKGSNTGSQVDTSSPLNKDELDEDEVIKKIIEKAKMESKLEENEICDSELDELPFCEICNEDAKMRCLGCKYLFCKRCFLEHRDDDDGCDRYEPYTPPTKL